MFHVALHEPEIAPNTGNLMRLTVNTGCRLHLIHPLGFDLDIAKVRRAGLDYRERANVVEHGSFTEATDIVTAGASVYAFTQRGEVRYTDIGYRPGDVFVFGKESVGLPDEVLHHPVVTARAAIPIAPLGRSLNLANAVAVIVFEAWRQNGFEMPPPAGWFPES